MRYTVNFSVRAAWLKFEYCAWVCTILAALGFFNHRKKHQNVGVDRITVAYRARHSSEGCTTEMKCFSATEVPHRVPMCFVGLGTSTFPSHAGRLGQLCGCGFSRELKLALRPRLMLPKCRPLCFNSVFSSRLLKHHDSQILATGFCTEQNAALPVQYCCNL